MPAFNSERYIGKALDSVRSQTYRNWEIIVTNDGGADGTSRIVAEFAQTASRTVRLLEHAKSQGPSAARNTAMKAAKGEYIAFLDADDFWLPEHLETVCAVLATGRADLAHSGGIVFRDTPSGEIELLPIYTIEVTNPPADLFRRNFINPSGAAITRRLMEKVGGFGHPARGGSGLLDSRSRTGFSNRIDGQTIVLLSEIGRQHVRCICTRCGGYGASLRKSQMLRYIA